MMSGMGSVFSYENQAPDPLINNVSLAEHNLFTDNRKMHFKVQNNFATNGISGEMMLQSTRGSIGTDWLVGHTAKHGYETETHIGRYMGKMQWLMPFIGFDYRYRKFGIDEQEKNVFGQSNTKDNRAVISLGVNYTLPMLVRFQSEVFTDGIVRLQLMREDIRITKRLRMDFMVNTDKEYMTGLSYILSRNVAARTHYDSDMGFVVGITVSY